MSFDYIGNKHSISPVLKDLMKEFIGAPLRGLTFGDLLCGTGSVSKMAIEAGCSKVISNDVLEFCRVLTTTLTNKGVDKPKLQSVIDRLHVTFKEIEDSDQEPVYEDLPADCFVCHNYSGCADGLPKHAGNRMFFTKENGYKIDIARQFFNTLFNDGVINESEKDALIASLLIAANKVSNVSVVFGAFLNKFKPNALDNLRLTLNVSDNVTCEHKVYKMDVFELLKTVDTSELDVVYYDPPYNSRRYDKNYSPPETIALYDNPELDGLTGLRVEPDSESHTAFCHKSKVKDSLEELIRQTKSKYLFISYSSESLLKRKEVLDMLRKYRKTVNVFEFDYKRFKSQQVVKDGAGPLIKEYLFAAK